MYLIKLWGSSFAYEFVVRDFTLQSQLISNNKLQKAKDLHSHVYDITCCTEVLKMLHVELNQLPFCVKVGKYQGILI